MRSTGHWRWGAVPALLAGVGVVLHFVSGSPLWLDEALSVHIARLPAGEIPDALARDGLPPLYYLLLHVWTGVFGDGDLAVRSLSGVLSLATLPLFHVAASRIAGRRVGLIVVGVVVTNPYALRYATEARMYALVMLLALAGWLLVDDLRRKPTWPRLAGLALVVGALLLTHYWTFWLVAAAGCGLAWRWHRSSDATERACAIRTIVALAAGGMSFVPWLPTFLEQSAHTATPWAAASRPTTVVAVTLADWGGAPVSEGLLLAMALVVLATLGVLGRRHARSVVLSLPPTADRSALAWMAAVPILFGALVSLAADSAFASRYAAVAFPFYALLVGLGIAALPDRRLAAAALTAVMALGVAVGVNQAATDRTQAAEIAGAIVAGDRGAGAPVVVYCPDQLGPAVHRLLPPGVFDEVVYPDLVSDEVDVPGRVDWYDYEERQARSDPAAVADEVLARAGDRNAIWVVWSPSYRTVEDRCPEMLHRLSTQRGAVEVLAPGDQFEHASLHLVRPR